MKHWLDILLPWRRTISVLNQRISELQIEKRVLERQLQKEQAERAALTNTFEQQKRGVSTLLQFIHSTQRLGAPLSQGIVQAAMARKNQ